MALCDDEARIGKIKQLMKYHQNHHSLASLLLMAFIWAAVLHVTTTAATRPNVLIILADDMGWGDLGINGNKDAATPHLDSLARDGILFDRFFVCPVCSPTRVEFLTGRYHPRSGVCDTSRGGERMSADEQTVADLFQSAGYATACFGKWHNGANFPHHPNARGFDEFYGFCSGHWGDYLSPELEHNGVMVKGQGFITDDLTHHASAFISQRHKAGQPFFVFLAFNTPHSPMQVPDEWWNKFHNKEITQEVATTRRATKDHTRAALALCENIDANVGRLLRTLDDLKISDDTIVLFFSDNGPNGQRWNDGMKGIKGNTDEGGVRSPLLIRWQNRFPAGKIIRPITAVIDILPTLTELAGVPNKSDKPLDGISWKPLLFDPEKATTNWPDRMIFSHWHGNVSARSQRYRLDAEGRLFDMMVDPSQRHDVSDKEPVTTRMMKSAVASWKESVLPQVGSHKQPFIIAHPDCSWSRLNADDARTSGSIQRSSVHPNCSYLTHWRSLEDRIVWDVEVMTAGNYQVDLCYACPVKDIGSSVEVSIGPHRITGKISQPHDPPLRGKEAERVPRSESYTKDFRLMNLGIMPMVKGKNTVTIKATEITGGQVMEFRSLTFTRAQSPAKAQIPGGG